MSKAIKWQIPFVSTIDKIQYRIDIYAEGYTGTPIQLTGGTNPIKTEEDKSDDFFAPVRGQTGNIEVVTKLPNGGTLDINDLLPSDNIDHPVRLVSISGNTETIEWQGFMSCEAYSQNYTAVPDTFSFPIISVLEAMASVEVEQPDLTIQSVISRVIKNVLVHMMTESGMEFYTYVTYSGTAHEILKKSIDQSLLFEMKEYINEDETTYEVVGVSVKDVLERIAKYMGWVVREQGTTIYFCMAGDDVCMYKDLYTQFGGTSPNVQRVDYTTKSLSADMDYRGVDHQRSIMGGLKSVEVVATIKKYNITLELPEAPASSLTFTQIFRVLKGDGYSGYDNNISVQSWVNENRNYISTYTFNYFSTEKNGGLIDVTGTATLAQVLTRALINPDAPTTYIEYNNYVGAFMVKIARHVVDDDEITKEEGLYIVCNGAPYSYTPTTSNHVFQMRSLRYFNLSKGELVIKYDMIPIMWGDSGKSWFPNDEYKYLLLSVQFGDKYWNGTTWTSSFSTFRLSQSALDDDGTYRIHVLDFMFGELIVRVYPLNEEQAIPLSETMDWGRDMFIRTLSIDYEIPEDETLFDRSENHYFRMLDTNFKGEVSVNCDFASSAKNTPSPSLIMNSATTAMTTLPYMLSDGTYENRRPEVDLLNRLATYYGAARQRLSLIVAHPTAAPLPLLRLNGISPDTRKYLPLAESRDWINDTSTLTCFETPQND